MSNTEEDIGSASENDPMLTPGLREVKATATKSFPSPPLYPATGMMNSENSSDAINNISADEAEQAADTEDTGVKNEVERPPSLYYKISDVPPLHLCTVFAFQQLLMSVVEILMCSLLVAEVVCATDDGMVKTQIMSTTMLLTGATTFVMVTFGSRLPVFQGPSNLYMIPLLALTQLDEWKCPSQDDLAAMYGNSSVNATLNQRGLLAVPTELIHGRLGTLTGSLLLAAGIHFLVGFTGLVGLLLRFIGPITIVPAITLVGLSVYKVTVKFSKTQWGVAVLTAGSGIIFSLYLRNFSTLLPAWNRKRGFHIIRFPLHQVFAVFLAIVLGWGLSAILTVSGALSDDPKSNDYYARTDSRNHVIDDNPWFYMPYPGQFGLPSFSTGVFVSFLVATVLSILDSIGDYSVCARMCFVPAPPTHAVNRGIMMEGLMTFVGAAFGMGHGTTTFGGNIGVIGLTKVASRRVWQMTGIIFIIMAIVAKIGAFFVTVPYCVIGGTQIITLGIFVGVILSNLHYVDLSSTRNLAIIGVSLLVGLMMPYWVVSTPGAVKTGHDGVDRILSLLFSNPTFVGGFMACFLDNTVSGTYEERGLHMWQQGTDKTSKGDNFIVEGPEVYSPLFIPERLKRSRLAKYIPFIPDYQSLECEEIQLPAHA